MARGGKRPGSGRKHKWGVPTVTMRVPAILREEVEAFITQRMAESVTKSDSERQPSCSPGNENASQSTSRQGAAPATVPTLQPRLSLELHAKGQCQAQAATGKRCRGRIASYLDMTLPDGREASIAVCVAHLRSPSVRVHPSIYENVTESDLAEVVEIWPHSGNRCQAANQRGERCRGQWGLKIVESAIGGKVYRMSVCPTHYRKFERRGKVRPHPECL